MAAADTQQEDDLFLGPIGPRNGVQLIGPDGQPIDPSGGGDPLAGRQVMTMMGDGYSADPGDYGMPDMSNGDPTPPPAPIPSPLPGDPTTPDGGRDPNAGPPVARKPPPNGGLNGQPNVGDPRESPTPPPSPPPAPAPQPGPDWSGLSALLASLIQQQQGRAASTEAYRNSLKANLDQVMADARKPVTAADPTIAGPTSAFYSQGQRSRALLQEQLAQEAAAGGKPTGAVDQAVKASFENLGNATGSYEAGMMRDELTQRRDMLKSALSMSAGELSGEEQAAMQEELATLNAKIAETNSRMGNMHFYDQLAGDLGSQTNSLDSLLVKLLMGSGQ